MEQKKIFEGKLITLGDSMVGKTSLILRFLENLFTPNYLSTIGFDLKKKMVKLDNGEKIKLVIYDTAGQERFKSLSRNYIKKADGILIVYDITNKQSFINVENWIKCAREEITKKIPMFLVGNKSDMDDLRVINQEDGENLSEQFGLKFYETSCKNGNNVENCFKDLAKELYEVLKLNEEKLNREGNVGSNKNSDKKVTLDEKKLAKKKKCC
jgi:small GTP-binding protein